MILFYLENFYSEIESIQFHLNLPHSAFFILFYELGSYVCVPKFHKILYKKQAIRQADTLKLL